MIGPDLLDAGYGKLMQRSTGRKVYVAQFFYGKVMVTQSRRRRFKTATAALEYSRAVLTRWRRLYALGRLFPTTIEERPDDAEPGEQISGVTLDGEVLPPVLTGDPS